MATGKITLSSLRGLDGWLWDSTVNGFGARCQTRGTFYYLRYRQNGAQRMHSIGRHGSPWTPDTARAEALRLLGLVVGGNDPFAPGLPTGDTFATTIDRYLARKRSLMRPRSFDIIERHLRRRALPLHPLALAKIDRRTIASLLGEAGGPVARNHLRSSLSAFFGWCVSEGLLDANPVEGTAKAATNGARERVLTHEEIKQLWSGLGTNGYSEIVRLLLLTGQRRGEIGQLSWREINLADAAIALPADRTKNHREHIVPLSRQALEILKRQPRRETFVFGGKRGFIKWDKPKAALDARVGIAPWTIHDIRRTVATGMAELGTLPHVVEAALNHVSGAKAGVAGTYNRAKYSDEVRDALQKWADHLGAITSA
jgi:integrase